ncbi:putative UDP-kanosamine synthase oxidoreductase subunit [Actinomadura rubteroloni]|uniref:Putative UDP-kanosamine synthase oxidoreductase subunit n=1 Tax=Actinomadura rubteroloni TaxID=1926885 RepID=A0A2P4UJR5_9ACTN|nr:NAD-dependent epimerase/dehydratase family protein [Actinomadura rubteroloni]POM25295.1 putative UDP-kanosamine synthase oxidoreductase subunit [Actinomadura rubteroloni]
MTAIRLAVVGCGAVTRECHLPALAPPGPFRVTALVDTDLGHARAAADACPGPPPLVADDLGAVADAFDAALVATPPASHVDLALRLAEAGKHVLVEKPVACSVAELDRLRGLDGPVVVVAQVRRLFPAASWVRATLAGGALGRIRRVRWDEGMPFAWPVTSAFTLGPAASGGGVLHDLGPHVLDLLDLWFGAPPTLVSVAHNASGGVETEAELVLDVAGTPVSVALSRLRTLAGAVRFEGTRGTLRVDAQRAARYVHRDADGTVVAEGDVPADPPDTRTRAGLFREQFAEFARAIGGRPTRLPRPDELRPVTELIERCHRVPAARLPRPWAPAPARVAVTGAYGFIGAAVVEAFADAGRPVTAVGRSLPAFARLAHLDVVRAVRDVRDPGGAFDGCDVVVHAAYGNAGSEDERWSVTVDGTAAVVAAARAAGVRRLVLIGSMAVYRSAAVLDETCPRIDPGPDDRSYAAQKLAAERAAFDGADGMEVVCLHPGVVYGPWGPNWTVKALAKLRADDRGLPSGEGGGICNAVHVHDVAAATVFLSALDAPAASYLLRGPDAPTWGRFYDRYRAMLGRPAHGAADDPAWPDRLRRFYADPTVIDTARLRAAGFTPRTDLAAGMAQVADWAAWAGLR